MHSAKTTTCTESMSASLAVRISGNSSESERPRRDHQAAARTSTLSSRHRNESSPVVPELSLFLRIRCGAGAGRDVQIVPQDMNQLWHLDTIHHSSRFGYPRTQLVSGVEIRTTRLADLAGSQPTTEITPRSSPRTLRTDHGDSRLSRIPGPPDARPRIPLLRP